MNKYSDHHDEWREEANRERYEVEQARRWAANHYRHPHDPDKVNEEPVEE